ncbi:S-adenosylmethionine decarboxylase proenzyme [Shewanella surugensis]|uniref:S-adenosylmethionine decarboxylase proenzyme n=2 Tax=Shewanella surugensis TaxID=212020 RepID=A0ABT0LEP5_9GAMM|nr:S-adenosylmethionine decarboxylase proenzyme [Shewanella surugensis]
MSAQAPSLRQFERFFWEQILSHAGANILSQISNDNCDAYLLSESSLFVWDKQFLMLTCGDSTLIESLLHFIEQVDEDAIIQLHYHRKSEFIPYLQRHHFMDDLKRINQKVTGSAFRVGHLDSHHQYVFCANNGSSEPQLRGCELVMYHIRGEFADYLLSEHPSAEGIRSRLGLEQSFPHFVFDDHCFSPFGYSVNGIYADQYVTIHITPQAQSSYVSLETNLKITAEYPAVLSGFLSMFSPLKWDVMTLNNPLPDSPWDDAFCSLQSQLPLSETERLFFYQYQQNNTEVLIPYAL